MLPRLQGGATITAGPPPEATAGGAEAEAGGRRRCVGGMAMQERNAAGQNQIVRFQAADMEILRQVGEMGYATITDWEYYERDGLRRNPLDPEQPLRTVDQAGPAVRLWEARVARGPLRNARMLLKEYLPAAKEVAEQELRVYTDLVDTYPSIEDFGDAPVATLRGWFKTSAEVESLRFRSDWQDRFPRAPLPRAGNIWLAFRWDQFKPMSELAQNTRKEKTVWDKIKMPKVWGVALPGPPPLTIGAREGTDMTQKSGYLKALIKECISSLVFLHERGVVHRSLGSPSVGLSSYQQTDAAQLQVKLRDFGFASRISRLDDETLRTAREAGANLPSEIMAYLATEDIYAMGYALAETIFSSLAEKDESASSAKTSGLMSQWLQEAAQNEDVSMLGPVGGPSSASAQPSRRKSPPTDQGALKKLMEDIYECDITGAFRDYCTAEPGWVGVCEFLDQENDAGWKLLESMISCRQTTGSKTKSNKQPKPKLLSEMTDQDIQSIQIPDSFLPSFTSDINKVPTARSLLDNELLRTQVRPWYARIAPPGPTSG